MDVAFYSNGVYITERTGIQSSLNINGLYLY